MKAVLLFPLMLLALSASASADTTVFDKYVYSAESVLIDTTAFTIYLAAGHTEIIADYGTGIVSIHNSTCASVDIAKLCVDNILFDTTKKEYKIKLRGISTAPSLAITRTFADDEVRVGEKVGVTVIIKNSGGYTGSVYYNDSFPKGIVEAGDSEDASIIGNSAIWKGYLEAGASESFSYSLKANATFERDFVASLDYMRGLTQKTIYSSTAKLKAVLPLEIIAAISASSAYLEEPENITINVTNLGRETILPRVEITFDSNTVITGYPQQFTKSGQTYTYSEYLMKSNLSAKNISKQFVFLFKGIKADTLGITIKSQYKDSQGTIRKLSDIKRDISIRNKGVKARSNFGDAQLEPGQFKNLKIWVQNLNPYSVIKNVYVKTNTSVAYVSDAYFGTLLPMGQVNIVDENFYAPEVLRAEGFILTTNVSYQTIDGKNYSELFKDTLTVRPVSELVITKTPQSASLKGGSEVVVTVTVRNPRGTELRNVAVSEKIPGEFAVRGPVSKIVALRAGETATVYVYTITAPKLPTEKEFSINTTVAYSEADAREYFIDPQLYTYSATSKIKVQPEEFSLSATKTTTAGDVYKGDIIGTKYVITNPTADKTAKNIVITFPLQKEFDSAGSRTYEIAGLAPGESIVVQDEEKIRPKYSGLLLAEKANLTYKNSYGDVFSVLSPSATVTVKAKQESSPMVVVEKSAPKKANNTDPFIVNLIVSNIGTKDTSVALTDDGNTWNLSLKAGTNASVSYSKQLAQTGSSTLSQAVASYAYGVTFTTGSNKPEVVVVNKPLLKIEKIAPEYVNNVENFTVQLKVTPLGKSISNVRIYDGGYSIDIPELSEEKTYSYQTTMGQLGLVTLQPAIASYSLRGQNFSETSNSPAVTVADKQFISVKKAVSPEQLKSGQETTVTITVSNSAANEISAEVSDGEESWQLTIPSGENESVSYKLSVKETEVLPAAKASYNYAGKALESLSNKAVVQVSSEAKVIKGESSPTIIDKIVNFLKAILTWKRAS
ncbi:MAG: hypothetical protein V1702_00535 [Candidatus Woesearchaeota archaeon]